MNPQFLLLAGGLGAASAVLHTALLTGSPAAFILAYLAQLPLFVAGLWMGTTAAGLAAAAGTLAAFAGGGFVFALAYLLANALPAFVVVRQALLWRPGKDGAIQFYPLGNILLMLVGMIGALFVGMIFAFSGAEGGLEGALKRFIVEAFQAIRAPGLDNARLEPFAEGIARVFPGIVGVSWLFMVVVNAALAQGLVARFGAPKRPSPSIVELDLPAALLGLVAIFAAGSILPGLGGFVSRNMIVLFVAVYALAGFGVLHALVARLQWRGLALGASYGAVIVFGWPIAVFAILGLVEPLSNFKARALGRAPNGTQE
ncbi:MAG: DUF2232 domain-containing protein [Azospirillum sp.]|nr:DUF2232 domain-containing protein [Azospirillum sp.]